MSSNCDKLSDGGKQNVPKKPKKKKRCLLDTEEVSKKMFGKDETKNESQSESVDVDDEDSGEEGSDDFDDIVGLDTSGKLICRVLYYCNQLYLLI